MTLYCRCTGQCAPWDTQDGLCYEYADQEDGFCEWCRSGLAIADAIVSNNYVTEDTE